MKMTPHHIRLGNLSGLPLYAPVLALIWCFNSTPCIYGQTPAQPTPKEEPPDVLVRGPIHEAYAKPATANPEVGPVVEKQPPEPIDEVPPDQKPEGADIEWIPGYWAWDGDDQQFDWVSGFWRDAPPNRDWVPGHWQAVEKGWMWVSGYWGPEKQTEVQYLPAPPPSVEDAGPSTPAPDATSSYVTGIWVYQQNRYFWRPGFWIGYRPGWVWNPACYSWTPTGYVFIDGYWDHPLGNRGLLFAPVRFGSSSITGRFRFTPNYIVHTDFLVSALFVGPGTRHFYFGDYFENRYASRGYVSWPDFRVSKTAYEANFNYYHHLHASDPRWESNLRDLYRGRQSGELPRPPRNLTLQTQAIAAINADRSASSPIRQNLNVTKLELATAVSPLKEVNNITVTGLSKLGQGGLNSPQSQTVRLISTPPQVNERDLKAIERLNQVSKERRETEAKIMHEGGVPHLHTDPAKTLKVAPPQQVPRINIPQTNPSPSPTPIKPPFSSPLVTNPPVIKPPMTTPVPNAPKQLPPIPTPPQHVQRPIPNFVPPRPPAPPSPPKKGGN